MSECLWFCGRESQISLDRQTDVHLSSMPIEDAVDVCMALVECVCGDVEPVLHVVPPALDGVHRCAAALVLPRLGELLTQQHHPRHPALHHADGVAAGAQDGLHLEEAPESHTAAEEQQSLRPQQQIARDPSEQSQRTHALTHTHARACTRTHTHAHTHSTNDGSASQTRSCSPPLR